jgi:hypothetical protein
MKLSSSLAISALALALAGTAYAQPANPGAGSGLPPNSPEALLPLQAAPDNSMINGQTYFAPYPDATISPGKGQNTGADLSGALPPGGTVGDSGVSGTGTGSGRP